MVLPFYWMVVTSVSPMVDITAFPQWIPSHLVLEHYQSAFHSVPFGRYYLNSLLVALGSVGTSILFGLLAGYAFVVYRFPLRDFFFLLILSTIMIPFQVTSISLYNAFENGLGGYLLGNSGTQPGECPGYVLHSPEHQIGPHGPH